MPAYSTSTNPKYFEIPQEVIDYLRMVPVRDSNVARWKTYKDFGGLRKGEPIVVPQCISGNYAEINFSIAGNSALIGGHTWINIYQSIPDVWTDAYWDGWLSNGKVDSPKAIQEAVRRIKNPRWWEN
jgi:hypothetical protein